MTRKSFPRSAALIAAILASWAAAHSPDPLGCPTPSNVYATEAVDCLPIEVYWDLVDAFDYVIHRATIDNPTGIEVVGNAPTPPFLDYSANYGVQYLYWVSAVSDCGESSRVGPDMGTRDGSDPMPPAWVAASDSQYCGSIVVDWDTSGGFEYAVYRSQTDDFTSGNYIGGGAPPFYDYEVAGNVAYYYWIIAGGPCGISAPSASDVGYANDSLSITDHPVSQTVPVGASVSFSVSISGFGSFEWYRNGGQLTDGGNISGAFSPTLVIDPVSESDAGDYQCVVYGGCGTQYSDYATLTVEGAPPCPADFNNDGGIDGADVDAFFAAWEEGSQSADVNQDGGVDGSDVSTFFAYWENGGC